MHRNLPFSSIQIPKSWSVFTTTVKSGMDTCLPGFGFLLFITFNKKGISAILVKKTQISLLKIGGKITIPRKRGEFDVWQVLNLPEKTISAEFYRIFLSHVWCKSNWSNKNRVLVVQHKDGQCMWITTICNMRNEWHDVSAPEGGK